MPLELPPEEPAFGPWRVASARDVLASLLEGVPARPGRPAVLAIDGRSASGKTTVAAAFRRARPGAAVVHTDDVAWHHAFFDWAELLREGVLLPARAGRAVRFRPPAWVARGREGAIEVPAGSPLLIVEGVGAARRELLPLVDAAVWVQSDGRRARARGIARDGGGAAAARFWDEWEAAELPFLAEERPWERARAVLLGTPELAHDPAREVVVAAPR